MLTVWFAVARALAIIVAVAMPIALVGAWAAGERGERLPRAAVVQRRR